MIKNALYNKKFSQHFILNKIKQSSSKLMIDMFCKQKTKKKQKRFYAFYIKNNKIWCEFLLPVYVFWSIVISFWFFFSLGGGSKQTKFKIQLVKLFILNLLLTPFYGFRL